MAEKAKVEPTELEKAQEKLKLVTEENELLKNAGNHDLSWYQKELAGKDKKILELDAEVKSLKQKRQLEELEKETLANDRAKEEELTAGMFNQSEHTRFRLLESPTTRDIFGDVVNPVFDLGVDLSFFSGPVQIPVGHVIEMATSIGMLTLEQASDLKDALAVSTAKNESAAILGTELTSGISALVDKFYDNLASVTAIVDASESDEPEESGKLSEESGDNESKSDEDSGQADVDNSGEGSDGVSNAATNTLLNNDGTDTRKLLDEL